MVKYTPEEVKNVVGIVKEDPRHFVALINRFCDPKNVPAYMKALKAWNIDYENSGYRTPRER